MRAVQAWRPQVGHVLRRHRRGVQQTHGHRQRRQERGAGHLPVADGLGEARHELADEEEQPDLHDQRDDDPTRPEVERGYALRHIPRERQHETDPMAPARRRRVLVSPWRQFARGVCSDSVNE